MTEPMNPQQIFNRVATHLLTQKRRAEVSLNGNVKCVYRAADGAQCAVGCLIPDDMFRPEMEGRGVYVLLNTQPQLHNLFTGFAPGEALKNFLGGLQIIHDGQSPHTWKSYLMYFATRYQLDASVLDTLPDIPAPEAK